MSVKPHGSLFVGTEVIVQGKTVSSKQIPFGDKNQTGCQAWFDAQARYTTGDTMNLEGRESGTTVTITRA